MAIIEVAWAAVEITAAELIVRTVPEEVSDRSWLAMLIVEEPDALASARIAWVEPSIMLVPLNSAFATTVLIWSRSDLKSSL